MSLKENIYEIRKGLVKRALPIALAASIAMGTSMGETKVKAYNLEAPSISYDDFKELDYTIIFLGGRMMEFTKESGYPYKKSKKLMVPMESICNSIYGIYTYDSKTATATIQRHGVTITAKKGAKKITVNDNGKKRTIKTKVANTVKKGKMYVTIAGIASALDLTLESDKTTGIINLDYKYDYKNIDLKQNENNLVDLNEIKGSYSKVMLDMTPVSKDYINVLKNTDQYKAFIENDTLYILSYQLFENIDYIYDKEKEIKTLYYNTPGDKTMEKTNTKTYSDQDLYVEAEGLFYDERDYLDEREFFRKICTMTSSEFFLDYPDEEYNVNKQKYTGESFMNYSQYQETLNRAKQKVGLFVKTGKTGLKLLKLIVNSVGAKGQKGQSAYDCLIRNDAKCTGRQNALELILRELGIPCVSVGGLRNGSRHEWGYAYFEEKWYLVDASFGTVAPIEEETSKGYQPFYKKEMDRYEQLEIDARNLLIRTYKFENYNK